MSGFFPLNWNEDVLAATRSPGTRPSAVISSSLWNRRPNGSYARYVAGEALCDDRLRVHAGERLLAGQHFVQNAAEAVDVAPSVDRALGARLLRAHISRRPDGYAGSREPIVVTGLTERVGDAEIRDHSMPVFDEDILGFDVAVHYPASVRVIERAGDFRHNPHRLVERQLLLAFHPVAE